jgi:DNA-binding response OmpR family regulator
MRGMFANVLKQDGTEVTEAADGTDLLHWAECAGSHPRRELFDAIVADIQLPDMTALDVLRRVPSLPRSAPLILVTAFGDEGTFKEAYDLGAEMILRKPVPLKDLCAVVRSVARLAV